MSISPRDPLTQTVLIIIASVIAIIIVGIAIYRINKSALRGWKEKLGIDTGRDLLIFFMIMGVACSLLVALVFASLGFVVPIPY